MNISPWTDWASISVRFRFAIGTPAFAWTYMKKIIDGRESKETKYGDH